MGREGIRQGVDHSGIEVAAQAMLVLGVRPRELDQGVKLGRIGEVSSAYLKVHRKCEEGDEASSSPSWEALRVYFGPIPPRSSSSMITGVTKTISSC